MFTVFIHTTAWSDLIIDELGLLIVLIQCLTVLLEFMELSTLVAGLVYI